jgi:hypothetical protein
MSADNYGVQIERLTAHNAALVLALRGIVREADKALGPYILYAGLTHVLNEIRRLGLDAIAADTMLARADVQQRGEEGGT